MGEGGRGGEGGEEVVGSVGLDLTNDVEAHSRQRPVTPRIVGQGNHHHHHTCYRHCQAIWGHWLRGREDT